MVSARIAAISRSNHKSQGFGSTPIRGEQKEYLELKKGDAFSDNNILSGIDISWNRYTNGAAIAKAVESIAANYDFEHPEKSIDALLALREQLMLMPKDPIVMKRIAQTEQIIAACLGLYIEPVSVKESVTAGAPMTLVSTVIRRADFPVSLERIVVEGQTIKAGEILPVNINQIDSISLVVPLGRTSSPYWLEHDYTFLFDVQDRSLIGKAENDPALQCAYYFKIGDKEIVYKRGVIYKETDAVKGEIIQPVAVLPASTIHPAQSVVLFTEKDAASVAVTLQSNVDDLTGYLFGMSNGNFKISKGYAVDHLKNGERRDFTFDIDAANAIAQGNLSFYFIPGDGAHILDSLRNQSGKYNAVETYVVDEGKGTYRYLQTIAYDHIPTQQILEHAEVKLVKVATKIPDIKVAYVEGAGDKVDESLRELGLSVTTIRADEITLDGLKKFDAVVVGVRAYNTEKAMIEKQPMLLQYVEQGGNLIVQYSTSWDAYVEQLGPYPFKVTRNRVTDEQSPVSFDLPDHPALRLPNQITQDDFQGWVQERGIYFAGDLAPEYQTPLSFQDPNEKMQAGSLIICNYGAGTYVYTGIAFFRELPAGVPGAYRLFINLLNL